MECSFLKIRDGVDVSPLLQKLNLKSDLFNEVTARQEVPGTPHLDTQSIFLRWARELSLDATFNDIEAVNRPCLDLLPEALDLIDLIAATTECHKLGRCLIVALNPGGFINPHADEGAYADYYERFHLSLQSDEGNAFFSEWTPGHGEFVHMKPGELWTFNHKRTHWLVNNSDTPRIHLIVDAVVPKYRRERV